VATSVISSRISDPAGTGIPNVLVKCRLYPRPAYATSTGYELAATLETTTESDGDYSFTLTETADITPAESYYVITEHIPERYGGQVKHVIQVGAADATVLESLVAVPPAPQQQVFLTQAAADARYAYGDGSGFGVVGDMDAQVFDGETAGILATAARIDHVHPMTSDTPTTIEADDAADEGASVLPSRADHKHEILTAAPVLLLPNNTVSAGSAATFSRSDHRHLREQTSGTTAQRVALTGADLYPGRLFWDTDLDYMLYVNAASNWCIWMKRGTSQFNENTVSSATYAAIPTNAGPEVTVVTGTYALVTICASIYQVTGGTGSLSVAVSGASTIAASDNYRLISGFTSAAHCASVTFPISGLTPGSNTFTMQGKTSSNTMQAGLRHIWVECPPL
jgi:hypothetical protein